jgi:hypothetical protein
MGGNLQPHQGVEVQQSRWNARSPIGDGVVVHAGQPEQGR